MPQGAVVCPDCGADERSGWQDDADWEVPEEDFDYEEFAAREFGGTVKPGGIGWGWWIAAGVLLLAFLARVLS